MRLLDEALEHAAHLLEAYFHQDALVDDADLETIVQRFKRAESQETLRLTRDALLQILERWNDTELDAFLFGHSHSFYDPRPEGLSPRAWIEDIVHLLAGGSSRPSGHDAVAKARRKALSIAREVLTGDKDVLWGARELSSLHLDVGVPESDPDFLCFVGIDSETVALGPGAVRSSSPRALHGDDRETDRVRQWAREFGRAALKNVVRRFGGTG